MLYLCRINVLRIKFHNVLFQYIIQNATPKLVTQVVILFLIDILRMLYSIGTCTTLIVVFY